jgi:hypothetical protein
MFLNDDVTYLTPTTLVSNNSPTCSYCRSVNKPQHATMRLNVGTPKADQTIPCKSESSLHFVKCYKFLMWNTISPSPYHPSGRPSLVGCPDFSFNVFASWGGLLRLQPDNASHRHVVKGDPIRVLNPAVCRTTPSNSEGYVHTNLYV